MINKVEIANVNTSKLQVLTADEIKELFRLMKGGDKSTYINSKIIDRSEFDSLLFL